MVHSSTWTENRNTMYDLRPNQCYWYQITENIGNPKNLYKNITETITGYGGSIAVKKYKTTTYNFNKKLMILCIKIQLIITSYQNTTNLKFKT